MTVTETTAIHNYTNWDSEECHELFVISMFVYLFVAPALGMV